MNASTAPLPQQTSPVFHVKKIEQAIHVTGRGDDPGWAAADTLRDFSYPWENGQPHPTTFRALHNSDWLYCFFQVTDPSVYLSRSSNDKREVAASSRAEIFFKINDNLDPYYCLELDPAGRVFDYRSHYYRNFDTDWCWPKGHLLVKTNRGERGYTVEVAVSKASLRDLQLLQGNTIRAGLYRADCFPNGTKDPDFKWISWVKPDSDTPDFHIPSSFGILHLAD